MQIDPAVEWRRLTEQYRGMSDEELRELAFDFADLTETAQQALRTEMRSRGLGEPPVSAAPAAPGPIIMRADAFADAEDSDPGDSASAEEDSGPCEYTWKTHLCDCETRKQAWQLSEVLRRAGIESWIDQPRSRYSWWSPRLMVAADQLEQARVIAARPIPKEIVEDSNIEMPEFESPACPNCGARDPVLDSVEPVNSWLCEVCGAQWTDSPPVSGNEQEPSP